MSGSIPTREAVTARSRRHLFEVVSLPPPSPADTAPDGEVPEDEVPESEVQDDYVPEIDSLETAAPDTAHPGMSPPDTEAADPSAAAPDRRATVAVAVPPPVETPRGRDLTWPAAQDRARPRLRDIASLAVQFAPSLTMLGLGAWLARAPLPQLGAPGAAGLAALACLSLGLLLRTRAGLLRSTAALTTTVENLDLGVMMVDESHRVPVINRRAIEMLGLPEGFAARDYDRDAVLAWHRGQRRIGDAPDTAIGLPRPGQGAPPDEVCDRVQPNGTVLEIRTRVLPDGAIVRAFTDVTRRRQVEAQIRRLALHDFLTGLPNRAHFQSQLSHAIDTATRTGRRFAVLCLDLDRFKAVNDTRGHAVGDRLLQLVGERLRREVRDDDPIARFGGDEFAVVQFPADQAASPTALATRLIEAISQPYEIDGQISVVTVSIGIAVYPQHGTSAVELLKHADEAMYRSKKKGSNTHSFYETSMSAKQRDLARLRRELCGAIARQELLLAFQPTFDTASREMVCVEALMRWSHPTLGVLAPDAFLQVAEESGLIIPIGHWALREACAEAAKWPRNLRLACNISPRQFADPELPAMIEAALEDSGLEPSRLELEITERALLVTTGSATSLIRGLKATGVSLVLDDFGSGHAGLAHLRRFPFDKLKIHHSLLHNAVEDAGSGAILRSLITLGHTLGLEVVAEGVESEAQLAWLRACECPYAQGFLLAEPMSSGVLRRLVDGAPRPAERKIR